MGSVAGCTPLILGDLNFNFEHPRDHHEENIADLIDEIYLVDSHENSPC